MKISRNWLQAFFDAPLPDAAALSDALTFHVFEIDGIEEKSGDTILDVKVTANRGHDCLCHYGIAKELSAILNIPLKEYPHTMQLSDLEKKTNEISATIDSPLCNRYIGAYVRGIKVRPSPAWLVERLEAMGQRPINNIVDAGNFVMFNIQQPLHAFDAAKVKDKKISVRSAKEGEKMIALDGKEYTLNSSMLVIADTEAPIGIAGVKGGAASGIDESTTDLIIESANFNGISVRKTAQTLKLRTDASARFEQVISPELAAYGMRAFIELILELAGGEVVGFVDVYPVKHEIKPVSVSLAQINAVLGVSLVASDIADVFTRLGFTFETKGDAFIVTPPFERLDLTIPEDLVEEVGRIIGYDKVPAVQLPAFDPRGDTSRIVNTNFYWSEKIREDLISQGYSEVFTSVFAEKGERVVANKVDGVRPYLRTTLVDGLSEALKKNIPNKDLLGLKEIKIFEIGTVWKDSKEVTMVGMVSDKEQATEKPLTDYTQQDQDVGHPMSYISDMPLSTTNRYASFSRFPYIVRDVAMWTPAGTDTESVMTLIRDQAGELLQRIALFDTFTKADKTSLAFRLIFQSFEKTLTDEEVNQIMQKVSAALTAKSFEIR
ncbi:phenylalanine--tRNA ligase subunit beta [Candidatus Kaiserbacteria bacterium]|nr:phenylalanine--tRNA ligase subunit beta [Candidatus Kaiserbacteria bacterium]